MSMPATDWVQPWGDRTTLWPKRMAYAVSLHTTARFAGRNLTVSAEDGALYHVHDKTVLTTPDGLRCDLPAGDITAGTGRIGTPDDAKSVHLELRLQMRLTDRSNLLINCRGVVGFDGGLNAFFSSNVESLRGSSFIATSHETDSPTFRWLNRRQLFGVGRIEVSKPSASGGELELGFDLYAAA